MRIANQDKFPVRVHQQHFALTRCVKRASRLRGVENVPHGVVPQTHAIETQPRSECSPKRTCAVLLGMSAECQ